MTSQIHCEKIEGWSFRRAGFSLLCLASTVYDIRRKLHMIKIHSTVGKQAKRMSYATVETTVF